jgi:hypothetical protein
MFLRSARGDTIINYSGFFNRSSCCTVHTRVREPPKNNFGLDYGNHLRHLLRNPTRWVLIWTYAINQSWIGYGIYLLRKTHHTTVQCHLADMASLISLTPPSANTGRMLFLFSLSYLPVPYLLSLFNISSSPIFSPCPISYLSVPNFISLSLYLISLSLYLISLSPYILSPCPISNLNGSSLISLSHILTPSPLPYLPVPHLISLSHILYPFPLSYLSVPYLISLSLYRISLSPILALCPLSYLPVPISYLCVLYLPIP